MISHFTNARVKKTHQTSMGHSNFKSMFKKQSVGTVLIYCKINVLLQFYYDISLSVKHIDTLV